MALFDDDDEDERWAVADLASSVGSLEDWTCTAEARSACLTMVAEMEAAAVMVMVEMEKILSFGYELHSCIVGKILTLLHRQTNGIHFIQFVCPS